MKFGLNMGIWSSVFAVPSDLIDKHLKLAGKEQLKTILFLLRHPQKQFSLSEIAAATGIPEDSAEEAIEYWSQNGILSQTEGEFSPTVPNQLEQSQAATPQEEPPAPEKTPTKKKRLVKPDGLYIAARINESDALRFLMQETESTLGKTISPALSSTLVTIHEDYGLPVEVILMIINYAKSVGKTSTLYIDSVSKDWSESGIFTLEDAEKKLQELDQKSLAWRKVESSVGIYHRAPTKKEEALSYRWIYEWKTGDDLIKEAYERCVDSTGKFAISYMNKILEKWHKAGYQNIDDIKAQELAKETKNEKSYDIDEFERMSFFNPPEV